MVPPPRMDSGRCPHGTRAIKQTLQAGHFRSAIQYPSVQSTNQVGLSEPIPDIAAPESSQSNDYTKPESLAYPRLVVADNQSAGRGRLGRTWHSDCGTLTFSLAYLPTDLDLPSTALPLVGLATGIAVAQAVEAFAPCLQTRLKWPNDVYAGGGKIAGILVETTASFPQRLVIGIGVNVATDFAQAPQDVQSKARSLAGITGRPLQRYDLLPIILDCWLDQLKQLRKQPESMLAEYRNRCLLTGHSVKTTGNGHSLSGQVVGVGIDGALRIATSTGVQSVRSGEVILVY